MNIQEIRQKIDNQNINKANANRRKSRRTSINPPAKRAKSFNGEIRYLQLANFQDLDLRIISIEDDSSSDEFTDEAAKKTETTLKNTTYSSSMVEAAKQARGALARYYQKAEQPKASNQVKREWEDKYKPAALKSVLVDSWLTEICRSPKSGI
ncbi:hypothetical protein BDA99DRAFT_566356 [Phascolomyces articulosus]|uniref:Uncharacterized protein n=1 Tax=Phascolomyces articulosus TaxID=60185 RepID=A0AAD5JWI4_9FUNG|nr:hypothetical protein BDA99DRAFT_566356 [Phascolomyces articulosus]